MQTTAPRLPQADLTAPSDRRPPRPRAPISWFGTIFIVLTGIVLPAVTLLVEALTHMCADTFFDPLPTVGHVFAIAIVPLAGVASLWALRRRNGAHLDAVIFAQAVAVAVAGAYALIFAPMTPVAVYGIVFIGLGLLPLSPLLSFIAGLRALFALRTLRLALGLPVRRVALGGIAAGLGLLVALNVPVLLTRVMLARAGSDDPAVSRSGITWLRRIGQRELMLRATSLRGHGNFDILSAAMDVLAPIPHGKAREIYYRVTGRPIESESMSWSGRANPLNFRDDPRRWDAKQGGDEVGVVALPGLSLASSRFDGSIDGRAALAYVEWTFELRNDAPMQREARAELALPPGGVVSRVTLWIAGEEREAAFAGRDPTRRAYERVVRARRDPILVTTSAPDRILVQCFPVEPSGGVMKARIGITAPLQLDGPTAGTLGLPYFTQRNFDVPSSVTHAVWIASKDLFETPAAPLVRDRVADGDEVRGKVPEPATPAPFAAVTVARPASATIAWTPERPGRELASKNAIIRQTLQPAPAERPSRLVVVVDAGGAMKTAGPVLAKLLGALPAGVPVAIELAGDDVVDLLGGVVPAADGDRLAKRLRDVDFAGGTDSLPALAAAWDLAAAEPGGAVLWIHGPQSMVLGSTDELRQRMERRKNGPTVFTYAAVGGENRLLAALADLPSFKAVPRYLPGTADLERFAHGLGGGDGRLVAVRTRETIQSGTLKGFPNPPALVRGEQSSPAPHAIPGATGLEGLETSEHLARLWAFDRIDALLHPASGVPPTPADRKQALALARRYHLVTAVSGAVVLDSQAEMDDLTGSDANTNVPTVPEPETWVLISLVVLVLSLAVRERRRLAHGGTLRAG